MTERVIVSAVDKSDAPQMPSWVTDGATTYAQAGVDTAEGARAVEAIKGMVADTYREEVVGDIGGFGGLFSVAAAKNMADPILVSGTDGVGTKLKLAQLVGKHDTVGIDLVAMCANDILATGAEPLFFLDYIAVGKLNAEAIAEIVSGIAEGCKQAGCALIGGEMAEHPGVMDSKDYDLSGFCVGLVDRPLMLEPSKVRAGDILLGLASSGLHSNGYSLARKVCVEGKTRYELRLARPELNGMNLEESLMVPTRIYVKAIQGILRKRPRAIHALAHITGGGISENLNRALPDTLDAEVVLGSWRVPAIARFVCDCAHLDEAESLKTFNMGLGMVCAVDPLSIDGVENLLSAAGETTYRIGKVVAGSGKVRYVNEGALFAYGAAEGDTDSAASTTSTTSTTSAVNTADTATSTTSAANADSVAGDKDAKGGEEK
ncbi:MAG: phosphoribosylformylglycinamidine cyclo-ligase [Eggerthellaceae bacterium]|jgi:phosphoribosylformylglycinamidine cyclo-ligase|nr:phosphoribosylformylglycinamidine cyclo-ligase [Eggerthellaceae bacterium]